MQFILDNLLATIISGTVSLVLLATTLNSNKAAVDQTMYYAAKKHTISLTEMIESDFDNIGMGVPPLLDPVTEFTDSTISFLRKLDPADANTVTVRYLRSTGDSLEVDGTKVPGYEVIRYVDGTETGKSPDYVSTFSVTFQDNDGNAVTGWATASSIAVQMHVAVQGTANAFVHETRWNRTFRPANLF